MWIIDLLYQVDCGQVRRGAKDPCVPGFLSVGVSKNRGNLGQSLSPFLLFTPKVPQKTKSFHDIDMQFSLKHFTLG